jgi:hypothetical protein
MKGPTMLTEALKRQFSNAYDVLQAAIKSFTPEQWCRGSAPFNGPGRAALHALLAAEYFTTQDRSVMGRFGKRVHEMADAEVPSQEQVLQYVAELRSKTTAWLDAMGDAGLAAPWKSADRLNGLEWVAYALRHFQHHTGEVCAYQKQCGLEPAPWK